MDGIHDLGGRVGFGAVLHAGIDDQVFAADWERRTMGLTFATFVRGLSNGGEFRHSIERMDPVHYATSRYYEHWLTAVATRLIEQGVVDADELEGRAGGVFPQSRPVHPQATQEVAPLAAGPPGQPYELGDRVRVTHQARVGHTRCPGYTRGHVGEIVRCDPDSSLADLEAHSDERRREPMYCVRFESAELWGPTAENAVVCVDLAHSYLTLDQKAAT